MTRQIILARKKFPALKRCVLLDDKLARGNIAPRTAPRVHLHDVSRSLYDRELASLTVALSDVFLGAVVGITSSKVVSGRWHVFGVRPPSFIAVPNGGVTLGWNASF